MRVIITGGTGLIGRHLAARLVEQSHEVIVLTRTPELDKKLPAGVRVVGWDAQSADGWGNLIDKDTAIVNLAGAGIADKKWTEERKALIKESRLHAGQAVVEAVKAASEKPALVIQASAVGYYGPRGDEVITEDAESPEDDFLAEVCRKWEASTQPVEEMGVRRAIIRTGVVLSMAGGAFPRMYKPFQFMVGGPVGDGQQWFPWIHIEDEVRAIIFLIENETASGVYNLSAPNPLTNAKFAREIGRVKKVPAILPAPAIALQLVFGEMADILLTGQRAVPENLDEIDFEFTYPEANAALTELLVEN